MNDREWMVERQRQEKQERDAVDLVSRQQALAVSLAAFITCLYGTLGQSQEVATFSHEDRMRLILAALSR